MPFTRIEESELKLDDSELVHLPWADETALKNFWSEQPNTEDEESIRNYALHPIEFLKKPRLNIAALENALASMLETWLQLIQQEFEQDVAAKLAHQAGRKHGSRMLRTFYSTHGLTGGAEAMARWQDTVHSLRGPRHATALFARYNPRLVVVVRTADAMKMHNPQMSVVQNSFLSGMADGYRDVDPTLSHVQEVMRHQDDGKVEYTQYFWFDDPSELG